MSRSTNATTPTVPVNATTANTPFELNRPSVFTELNDRDRFAAMESNRHNSTNPPNSTTSNPIFTPNCTMSPQDHDGEWLLVGKNGKITASNRNQKQVLPNNTGIPCVNAKIPDDDASIHWQVEISFIPTNSQVVSVPKAMTAFLNHLQAVNHNTVLAPVHYKDATDDEYIVKPEDVPLNEQELTPYLVKYDNTRSGRIGLSVIVASTLTFNKFKQDKTLVQWFQEEKMSVLLDMIDVIAPRQAGFFIRLLPKAESVDYHHLRISSHIPEAPTFQLVARTLKTKNPKGGKDRSTTVLYAVTDSEDCDAVVHWLRVLCDNVAGYEFYPLEEFLCLDHPDKVNLINRQIEFASKYASIVATGFNFEPPHFKMWMPPIHNNTIGSTSGTAIAIDIDDHHDAAVVPTTTQDTNLNNTQPPSLVTPDDPTSMVVNVSPPLNQDAIPDIWDDDMSDVLTGGEPKVETVHFCDDSITSFKPAVVASADDIIRQHEIAMVQTGQQYPAMQSDADTISTGTMDPPQSNKRLRTTNGSVATSVRPRARTRPSSEDLSHISVSQFLYTVKSGDNTPLFAFVYEPVDGQRELLTTKYQEAARFIHVIHPYLVRRMNSPARAIMYPNMDHEVANALQEPDWQPFRIFSQVQPKHLTRGSNNSAGTLLSRTQYQYHSQGVSGRGGGRLGTRNSYQSPELTHWSCTRHMHQTIGNNETTYHASASSSHTSPFQGGLHLDHAARSKIDSGTTSTSAQLMYSEASNTVTNSGPNNTSLTRSDITTTYTASATAISLLQEQMEQMQMKQQTMETRLTASLQSNINESIGELEQRQATHSQANNAAIQAELNKNKQEVSNELSATMQFLKMLNDNALTAKQQTDAFQSTVLLKLGTRDQELNLAKQQLTEQGLKLANLTQTKTPVIPAKENRIPGTIPTLSNPVGTKQPGNIITPIPRIGTLPKRQQQQSILATMSRIGVTPEKEEDTEMSRPETDHGADGKIHRPDHGTTGSAHHT